MSSTAPDFAIFHLSRDELSERDRFRYLERDPSRRACTPPSLPPLWKEQCPPQQGLMLSLSVALTTCTSRREFEHH
jgi:hypothetical protein